MRRNNGSLEDLTASRSRVAAAWCGVALASLLVMPTPGAKAWAGTRAQSAKAAEAAKAAKTAKAASRVPSAPQTASALLTWFRKSPGLQAHFVESKQMALLAAPLRSEGRLYYVAPGLLARHIDKPSRSVVLIEPHRVRMLDGGVWQAIDLKTRPVVRRFVGSFVSLLRGDEAQLRKLYAITYTRVPPPAANARPTASSTARQTGAAKAVPTAASTGASTGARTAAGFTWRLLLRPKVAPLNKVVKTLELTGSGLVVRTMRMLENDGDETVTTFSHVDAARRFTATERAALFFTTTR